MMAAMAAPLLPAHRRNNSARHSHLARTPAQVVAAWGEEARGTVAVEAGRMGIQKEVVAMGTAGGRVGGAARRVAGAGMESKVVAAKAPAPVGLAVEVALVAWAVVWAAADTMGTRRRGSASSGRPESWSRTMMRILGTHLHGCHTGRRTHSRGSHIACTAA